MSAFDLLLDDPSLSSAPSKTFVKNDTVSSSNPLDWLLFDSDVLAPHPDAFESELDSIALGSLEADLAALPSFNTVDSFNISNFNLFSQYRGGHATSAYSGYGGAPSTITVSSENLSAYGSTYEPYEKYTDSTAGSGAQLHQGNQQSSLSSLFPDIDLNFTAFNLAAVTPISPSDSMLPPRNLETSAGSRARSHGSSSAYDSASPSYDGASGGESTSYYPVPATTTGPAYLASAKSLPAINTGVPAVPRNANSALITPTLDDKEDAGSSDPRKKYSCPNCPRAFARAFNLKTHLATHDPHRVKNFQCRHSGCGRSFSRKHDLGRHLVSIHQDTSVVSSSPTATSVASGSGTTSRPKAGAGIGVAANDKQRIWCDSCGRGWLAGSREACDCKGKSDRVH